MTGTTGVVVTALFAEFEILIVETVFEEIPLEGTVYAAA
jgi:hypothetical protein